MDLDSTSKDIEKKKILKRGFTGIDIVVGALALTFDQLVSSVTTTLKYYIFEITALVTIISEYFKINKMSNNMNKCRYFVNE